MRKSKTIKMWHLIAIYVLAVTALYVVPQVPEGFVHISHKARGEERP